MKIFISWSGERSRKLAELIEEFLIETFPGFEIFLSIRISPGDDWNQRLRHVLGHYDFGIIAVTPENIDARWVLFEAGALAKSPEGTSTVVPFLFDLSPEDLPGPLNQFFSLKVDNDGAWNLTKEINRRLPRPSDDQKLRIRFDSNWSDVSSRIELLKDEVVRDIPQVFGLANQNLFESFYLRESDIVTSRLEQLRDGYQQIFGRDVERVEDELFDHMAKGGMALIRAVDLTMQPEVLPSRTRRSCRRQDFINAGGLIQRVFILDDTRMETQSYRRACWNIIEQDKEIGVEIEIRFISNLQHDLSQDFIIYGNFAVMLEGLQADPSYRRGNSTLYFKKSNYEDYSRVFNQLWKSNSVEEKKRSLLYRMLSSGNGGGDDFDYREFLSQFID